MRLLTCSIIKYKGSFRTLRHVFLTTFVFISSSNLDSFNDCLSIWLPELRRLSVAPSPDIDILNFKFSRDSLVLGDTVLRALSFWDIYLRTLREYFMNWEVEKSFRISSFMNIFSWVRQFGVGSWERSLTSLRHVRTSFLSMRIRFFFLNCQLNTKAKNSFAW